MFTSFFGSLASHQNSTTVNYCHNSVLRIVFDHLNDKTKPKSTIGGEPVSSNIKISLSKYIIWSYPSFGKCAQF